MDRDERPVLEAVADRLAELRRHLTDMRDELEDLKEAGREEEGITDEHREQLRMRFSLLPDAELLWMLLAHHKGLEQGDFRRHRQLFEIETLLLGEVFVRWVPEETFALAMKMLEGDEPTRFPDFDDLGL